jgi:acyl-CoA dehydrogenase
MISLELPESVKKRRAQAHKMAKDVFRPISRYYDENEHEYPKELDQFNPRIPEEERSIPLYEAQVPVEPEYGNLAAAVATEEFCWGDLGLYTAMPMGGLGNSAIWAIGTKEQIEKFGPMWCAMALTEPETGSDAASVSTTAELDGDEYILNGEKIFVTDGDRCQAVVVWTTLDKEIGRPAMKSFIVEKGTPGFKLEKMEHKLGIRASDTTTFVLKDCRVPKENLLGSPEIQTKKGFGGVHATFDAVRPQIAAQAVGISRACLEVLKEEVEKSGGKLDYKKHPNKVSAVEKEYYKMEATMNAMRLLVWRACWMIDKGMRNSVESSMSKGKCGRDGTLITHKVCELLGSIGFSQKHLVEKWMRDVKITNIYDGTQQIQSLIVARQILGLKRDQLK